MITIVTKEVAGIPSALEGMRYPHHSNDKSDSRFDENGQFIVGPKDLNLAIRLANAGPVHGKYLRQMMVWCTIEAPFYWWKEFDTYRMGVERDSESTMHTIHKSEITTEMFSHEHMKQQTFSTLENVIDVMNFYRGEMINSTDPQGQKENWWQMIQLQPISFNQKRMVCMSYAAIRSMVKYRTGHKQDEWRITFMEWAHTLPLSELLFCEDLGERVIAERGNSILCKCKTCNAFVHLDDNYCPHCGKKFAPVRYEGGKWVQVL